MANEKNLKPFKPGHDPNRNLKGRPPKLPHLEKLLDEVLGEEKEGVTAVKVILMALRNKATKGDIRAAEILLERAYGKSIQQLNIETNVINVIVPPDADSQLV